MKKNLDFSSMSAVEAGYHRRQRKSTVITLVLAVLVLMLAAFMMLYGNTIYTPRQVWDALNEVEGSAVFTVKTLRLPRMLTAILAGFAFGMAGNTFQQLLGNPLASPDIIGVTSGASVAAVFGILVLKLPGSVVSLLAVASGFLFDLSFGTRRRFFKCTFDFDRNWYAGIFECNCFMAAS